MDNEKYTKITYNVHDDLEHKIYICNMYGKYLSPFHDIPIYPNESDTSIVNMIVEIPKNTRKKMEISKTKVKQRADRKTNPDLKILVDALKQSKFWMDVAYYLTRPTRQLPEVSVAKLGKDSKEGEIVLDPF